LGPVPREKRSGVVRDLISAGAGICSFPKARPYLGGYDQQAPFAVSLAVYPVCALVLQRYRSILWRRSKRVLVLLRPD
jgi:hypothetical protein